MTAYYNENDPFAAAWLRELIKEGVVADGVVDSRSIKDVQPADLRGFTQHHFFAGIGGWSYALRLAGWPDDKPVWTGSCPCQPFSAAGKRKGNADERHLWPEFQRLIADCEPAIVFGEQVASKDGRIWLAGVRADLEALGYAVGAADLCAAGCGAPHIRQRLWWVADAARECKREQTNQAHSIAASGEARAISGRDGKPMAYPNSEPQIRPTKSWTERHSWCAEPAVGRVVDGIPHSVAAPFLRGFGNAIVPPLAAEFISAYRECCVA